jgi:hypothetical protein
LIGSPSVCGSVSKVAVKIPLENAVASHKVQPDQTAVEFEIPARGPYERKAHPAVKQRLWNLGLQDRDVLDSLGQDQAKAIEAQIHIARRQMIAQIKPYKIPRRIFGWGFCLWLLLAVASDKDRAQFAIGMMTLFFLLWAAFYMAAQSKLRSMGIGSSVTYAQGRAVYMLGKRLR